MTTQRLHKSAGPPACTATKAAKLCRQRVELDQERLELDRAARALTSQIATIDDELIRFAKTSDPPVVDVARFTIAVVQAPGFFSYKDNLVSEIGLEEYERRKSAVPTKDKLVLTEKSPATRAKAPGSAARVRRSEKAA
jgi:hypothetical protein